MFFYHEIEASLQVKKAFKKKKFMKLMNSTIILQCWVKLLLVGGLIVAMLAVPCNACSQCLASMLAGTATLFLLPLFALLGTLSNYLD